MTKLFVFFLTFVSAGCATMMSQIQPYTNYVFANVPAKVALDGIPGGTTVG